MRHHSGKLNKGLFLHHGRDLRIGGVTFAIFPDPSVRLRIANPLYRPFIGSGVVEKRNFSIPIRLKNDIWPQLDGQEKIFDTKDSWSMYRDSRNYWLRLAPARHDKPLWVARFDRRASRVTIFCQSRQTEAGRIKTVDLPLVYPLDQLLLMYFLAKRKGMLLHAAGMVRRGKAYLFAGASGAGKSTLSGLLAEARVGKLLSDERMVVREIAGTMHAFGTPWAGTSGIARNGSAPAAGIYFLRHGRDNHMEKLPAAEALDGLLPLVSIPWYDPDTMSPIIAFAKQFLTKVPAFEMSFVPDSSASDFFLKAVAHPS